MRNALTNRFPSYEPGFDGKKFPVRQLGKFRSRHERVLSGNCSSLQYGSMNAKFTAVVKQRGEWWIGWIEEVPGVNAQEHTKPELLKSLREALLEALEFNREEARRAAEGDYIEEAVMV
jgi:predicted RNase H-like HicB family nuclease